MILETHTSKMSQLFTVLSLILLHDAAGFHGSASRLPSVGTSFPLFSDSMIILTHLKLSEAPASSYPVMNLPQSNRSDNFKDNLANTSTSAAEKLVGERIKSLGNAKKWEEAKKLFESVRIPGTFEFAAVIYAARVCQEYSDGMMFFRAMVDSLGPKSVNLYVYDHIISLNLDRGDDERALQIFANLQDSDKAKKSSAQKSNKPVYQLTAASQINLEKCIFNALRASLNIQFKSSTISRDEGEISEYHIRKANKLKTEDVEYKLKTEDIEYFDASSPSKNVMERTITSILGQGWSFLPRDKSLIVRAYASWNMTIQLAEMTDFIFKDPLPDMWTLETYMAAMMDGYPELSLQSLQWYLPVRGDTDTVPDSSEKVGDLTYSAKGYGTILSDLISDTAMNEKRRARDLAATGAAEAPSARCLGLAVKAVSRLDYYVGHSSQVEAILQLLKYAEDNSELTAGLVVAAIGACRDLNDWQGAFQIYNSVKLAAAEGRLFDSSVGSLGDGQINGARAEAVRKTSEGQKKSSKKVAMTGNVSSARKGEKAASTTSSSDSSSNRAVNNNGMRVLRAIPSIIYGQAVLTMAKDGAEAQCYQIFCEMLEAGIVPSTMTTNNVIMQLSKTGSHKVATGIVDQLERYQISVSSAAMNALMNACDKVGAHGKVLEMFATKKITAADLDEVGLSVLIKSCDRLGDAEWAVTILKEAIKAGLRVDFSIYQRVFAILVKSPNAAQSAVDMLLNIESAAKVTSRIANKVSGSAAPVPVPSTAQAEGVDEVESIMDSLEDGLDFYSPFNSASDQPLDSEVLSDSFRDLLAFTTPPVADPCIYSATISSLSHNRLAKEASALLKSYSLRGGYETEEMYTSAIYSHRYQRNPDEAKNMFDMLKTRAAKYPRLFPLKMPLSLSPAPYNALLAVYAVSKVLDERGEEILEEMRTKGLAWDSYTYTALMMGRGDRQEVIRLWDQMVFEGVLPTQAAAAELFKACEMEGAGLVSLKALKWLWTLNPSFPSEDVPGGTVLPSTSSSTPSPSFDLDIDVSASLSDDLSESSYALGSNALPSSPVVIAVPDLSFCSRTLSALSNQGLSGECLLLLEEMRARGLTPTPACYAVALNALEKESQWQKAVNLLLQMQTRGVQVDYRAVNTAMSACSKASQWGMVLKLYDQMPTVTGHAFVPNQFSYFQALVSACRTKNPTKALEILRMKTSVGILPSTSSIAQVMAALEAADRQDETVIVFEEFVSCHLSAKEYDAKEAVPTPMMIDLHGYSIPIARAAVRSALYMLKSEAKIDLELAAAEGTTSLPPVLQAAAAAAAAVKEQAKEDKQEVANTEARTSKVPKMGTIVFPDRPAAPLPASESPPVSISRSAGGKRSLIIITGIGRNSREEEPVLKPSLQSWLETDFSPPLQATELLDNPGRLLISGDGLLEWINSGSGSSAGVEQSTTLASDSGAPS